MVSECVNLEILRYAVDPAAAAAASKRRLLESGILGREKATSLVAFLNHYHCSKPWNSSTYQQWRRKEGCPFFKGANSPYVECRKKGQVLILGSVFYDGPHSVDIPSYAP